MKHFDIAIVGAGPVGASFACALGQWPLRIALIEAKAQEAHGALFDRPISLSFSSVEILKNISVWERLVSLSTPIKTVHVSEEGQRGSVKLHAEEAGVEAFGFALSFQALTQGLSNLARRLSNTTWFCPAKIAAINQAASVPTLNLEVNGVFEPITADLVVAADGTHSSIKKLLGILSETYDYEMSAIVTEVQAEKPQPDAAFERFLRGGILAFLPLSKNHYGVVWALPTQAVERLMALDESTFIEKLQTAFGLPLGQLKSSAPRQTHALVRVLAKEVCRPGFVLIGNAATTLHPIAAQGFNLGLKNMAFLVEHLSQALKQKINLGSFSVLNAYAKRAAVSERNTRYFTEGLYWLFSESFWPLVGVRQAGMALLPFVSPAKKLISRLGMGLFGELPRLVTKREIP